MSPEWSWLDTSGRGFETAQALFELTLFQQAGGDLGEVGEGACPGDGVFEAEGVYRGNFDEAPDRSDRASLLFTQTSVW